MTGVSPERIRPAHPTPAAIAGRLLRPFLPLAGAVPILWLTLMPGRATDVVDVTPWCVVCGARGIADGLLNLALFVPLGWALGANGRRPKDALAIGLLLSGGIEIAQIFLPNRFPGIGDVLYNGAGACLGALLWAAGAGWLRPAARHPGRRVRAWGGLGLAAILSVPLLLAPALPPGRYMAHWAPGLEGYDVFRGRLLDARIAGGAVRQGTVTPRDSIPRRLLEGTTVELSFRVGPAPKNLAPIFTLTRGERVQTLLIGVDDRDVIVRYRTWSERLLLDRPDLRDPGTPGTWEEGDTVALTVEAAGEGVRVRSGDGPARRLAIPSSRGWSFLIYGKELDRRWGGALDFAWLVLWAIPLGLWAPGLRAAGPAAAWAAALLLVPFVSPVLSPGWPGVAGIAIGPVVGRLLSRTAMRVLGLEARPDPGGTGTHPG